jgi:hypothetical protein
MAKVLVFLNGQAPDPATDRRAAVRLAGRLPKEGGKGKRQKRAEKQGKFRTLQSTTCANKVDLHSRAHSQHSTKFEYTPSGWNCANLTCLFKRLQEQER